MIRSSINLIPEAPVATVVGLAQQAEALGFDRCWVYDEGLATRDVYVTLAAIAGATSSIELGTGITNPYTRHPATTAAAIASIDELSGGRAFLGIGAGGSLTLTPLAVDRSRPLSAVRDMVAACRALFSGAAVTMVGEGFELRQASLGYARAGLPIWLAGRGPRMLALGGAVADGVMLDFIHRDSLAETVALVTSAAALAGNRPRLSYSTMVITDDAAMAATRPHMTYRLVDSPPEIKARLGLTDHDVAAIREAMADGLHAAGELVRPEWVEPFVISGTADQCAARLGSMAEDLHLDEFLLPVLDLDTASDLIETVADVLARL